MRKISYREALNEAMIQEMEKDPNVFVYGLDVADHKNIWQYSWVGRKVWVRKMFWNATI